MFALLSLEQFLLSVCLHVRPLSVIILNKEKQCQKLRTSVRVYRATRGTVCIFITRYKRHCTQGSKSFGRTCPGMQELYMNKSAQWRTFICHAERNFTTKKKFSIPILHLSSPFNLNSMFLHCNKSTLSM
jgi:hypothetical protein